MENNCDLCGHPIDPALEYTVDQSDGFFLALCESCYVKHGGQSLRDPVEQAESNWSDMAHRADVMGLNDGPDW